MIIALELAAGLVLLFVGAEFLVRGAAGIAARLGVSPMIIGLTVVAYGTTAPELIVSVEATLAGAPSLAIGNIVGSNIANILLNFGIAGLIAALVCPPTALRFEAMLMIGAGIMFLIIGYYGILDWWIGVVFLILLFGVTFGAYRRDVHANQTVAVDPEIAELTATARWPWPILITAFLAGLAGILFGADFLVDGASALAREAGISETVIGLTLVAVGTSLPELATAIVAALRRQTAIAVGNVIGANIYNIFGITGVVAFFGPIRVPDSIVHYDQWVMFGAMAAMALAFRVFGRINRVIACGMLVLYGLYVASQFMGMSGVADIMIQPAIER